MCTLINEPINNMLIFLFAILAIAFLNFIFPFVLRLIGQYKLQKYCSKSGILVLSYDDGPGPKLTRRLLKILEDEGVSATFFFVGMRASQHLDIVRQTMDAGHEIGLHGQNHINYWKISPKQALNDIKSGYKTLSKVMPSRIIFRPPFGKLPLIPLLELKRQGIKIGWWTYVSGDTFNKFRSIDEIVNEVSKNKGGVVLLHDHDRVNNGAHPEPFVLELTQRLILMAKQKKFTIKKLGDVIEEMDSN